MSYLQLLAHFFQSFIYQENNIVDINCYQFLKNEKKINGSLSKVVTSFMFLYDHFYTRTNNSLL